MTNIRYETILTSCGIFVHVNLQLDRVRVELPSSGRQGPQEPPQRLGPGHHLALSPSPCIIISHILSSHLFIVRTITLIEYSALLSSSASCSRLFQGKESSPRCSSFSSFFAKSCLRSNCSPSLLVWTRPNKRTRRNTSIAFRSLFKLIMSCLLLLECFFLPSLVKYYITECHLKQAIFFLNHGAACNQRLQLKKWSQVGVCQVPTDDQEARTTPGRKRQVAGSPPRWLLAFPCATLPESDQVNSLSAETPLRLRKHFC